MKAGIMYDLQPVKGRAELRQSVEQVLLRFYRAADVEELMNMDSYHDMAVSIEEEYYYTAEINDFEVIRFLLEAEAYMHYMPPES